MAESRRLHFSLGPDDLDAEAIKAARITYLEGYLFDPPHAQEAFRRAARIAHEAGNKVAITLSDPFCVERHRDAFLDFIRAEADILFANEHEILTLYKTEDFAEAATAVRGDVGFAALTRSRRGSVIFSGTAAVRDPRRADAGGGHDRRGRRLRRRRDGGLGPGAGGARGRALGRGGGGRGDFPFRRAAAGGFEGAGLDAPGGGGGGARLIAAATVAGASRPG